MSEGRNQPFRPMGQHQTVQHMCNPKQGRVRMGQKNIYIWRNNGWDFPKFDFKNRNQKLYWLTDSRKSANHSALEEVTILAIISQSM